MNLDRGQAAWGDLQSSTPSWLACGDLLSCSLTLSWAKQKTLSYANSSAAKGAYQASIFYVRIEFCHEQIDTLLIQIHFVCILGIESELMISDSWSLTSLNLFWTFWQCRVDRTNMCCTWREHANLKAWTENGYGGGIAHLKQPHIIYKSKSPFPQFQATTKCLDVFTFLPASVQMPNENNAESDQ